jgi:hypothetical protein
MSGKKFTKKFNGHQGLIIPAVQMYREYCGIDIIAFTSWSSGLHFQQYMAKYVLLP